MLKYKSTWILFFTCTAVSISTRIVQLLYMIETDTGFIKRDFEQAGIFIKILYVAMILLVGAFAFTSGRFPEKLPQGSKPLAVFAFLAALGQLYELVASKHYDSPAALVLYSLLLLLSAVFFVLYGLSQLISVQIPNLLTLIPVVTMIFKLVMAFMRYTGMANISENLFDIGMLIFLSIFFLWFGKILNGMVSKYNIRVLFASGLLAAFFCFVYTIPRFFIILAGMGSLLHTGTFPNPANVAAGLFIVAFLLEYFGHKNLKQSRATA